MFGFLQLRHIHDDLTEMTRSNILLNDTLGHLDVFLQGFIQLNIHHHGNEDVMTQHLQVWMPKKLRFHLHLIRALRLSYVMEPALDIMNMAPHLEGLATICDYAVVDYIT